MIPTASAKITTAQFFGNYDAGVRRELEIVASYPNEAAARNQRLEGKVGVAFEVNSSGDL